MISKRTLLLIILLGIVTIVLIVLAVGNPAPQTNQTKQQAVIPTPTPAAQSILTFEQPQGAQSPQQQLGLLKTLDIVLTPNINKVGTVQLELGFDPKVVYVNDITSSEAFSKTVQLTKEIDNTTGRISFALGLSPKQDPIATKGAVATITYKIINPQISQTQFYFLPKTQVAAVGVAQSVLSSAKPLTIQLISPTPSSVIIQYPNNPVIK